MPTRLHCIMDSQIQRLITTTPANPKMHPVNFLPVSFSFRTIKHDIRIAIKFPKPVMIPPFTPDVCATPI